MDDKQKINMRTAIIRFEVDRNYRGDSIRKNYKFLCWNDDKDAVKLADKADNEGYELFTINIPYPDNRGEEKDAKDKMYDIRMYL